MSAPGDQITQLYWDWTRPSQTAKLWQNESIGGDGFSKCVPDGPFAYAKGGWNISVAENLILPFDELLAELPGSSADVAKAMGSLSPSCLVRQFSVFGTLIEKNPTLPTSNHVEETLQIVAYDSWPYDKNSLGSVSFRNVLAHILSLSTCHVSIHHLSISIFY